MKRLTRQTRLLGLLLAMAFAFQGFARCQEVTVSGNIEIVKNKTSSRPAERAGVVVWLTPVANSSPREAIPLTAAAERPQLAQKGKRFQPHVLLIPVGTVVEFPNLDPIFHNVFSLYEGKRFDLGLYESGTTRAVKFDHPGVSYIFCNIHPEMSAVVIALPTPYYGVSNREGQVSITNVPTGRYVLHVWQERSLPATLKNLTREIAISESSRSWGTLTLAALESPYLTHKNKYSRDYDPSVPPNAIYAQP